MAAVSNETNVRGNYRCYSVFQKKRAIEMAAEKGILETSRLLKIPIATIGSWKAKFATAEPEKTKNPGPPAQFPDQENELYSWILLKREQHLPVSRQAIRDKAKTLIHHPDFKASGGWLDRFLRRKGLSLRCKTTTAQHLPDDLEVRIRIFHRQVEELRSEHSFDIDCIVNMDETPVYFDLVPDRTISKKGAKDVVVRSTGAQKRHVTVALAVSASGETLPPLVIFKGKRFPKDVTRVPDGIFVEMNPNGWMTQEIMGRWVTDVLRPYTKRRPCLLVMDSFTGHTADRVNQELWKINATPAIIPGGCTSKVQPLDVSINKPFKAYLRQNWTRYIESLVDRRLAVKTVSRQVLLEWVLDAWRRVEADRVMIQKSFEVTGILSAVSRGEQEVLRNEENLRAALADDDSVPFLGFTAEDLGPEPEGYDTDPFNTTTEELE